MSNLTYRRAKADRLMGRNPLFYKLAEPVFFSRNFQKLRDIIHHDASIADHVVSVAFHSFQIAHALGLRKHLRELVRGALLHDYFFYDWRSARPRSGKLHGFEHPKEALENARQDFGRLTPIEEDCISRHMFPLTPIPPVYAECLLVCLVDKIVALAELVAATRIHQG
ncbi:HD domain-containing protein [Gracilinema caldarium]|uniref:HD domain-containing protein n=1 Tax=Gracilinema caldarium TaxID=215591 RepID=UPI0026EC9720|nr:HD domain-containing protein [Gracilinema caldarium]